MRHDSEHLRLEEGLEMLNRYIRDLCMLRVFCERDVVGRRLLQCLCCYSRGKVCQIRVEGNVEITEQNVVVDESAPKRVDKESPLSTA